MTRLSAAFGRLFDLLALVAAFLLLAMVCVVTGDILVRNFTRGAFVWANEISEYSLYAMTLLVAPWLLRQGRHVRLDLILASVPRRVAWHMEVVGDLVGFVSCVVLARYSADMTFDSWRLGSITIKNLVFPEWWLLVPLPLVLVLLAIEFMFRLHRLSRGDGGPRREATSVG